MERDKVGSEGKRNSSSLQICSSRGRRGGEVTLGYCKTLLPVSYSRALVKFPHACVACMQATQ